MNANHENHDEALLTAYALGQLDETERAKVEKLLADSPEAREFVAETSALAERVRDAYQSSPTPDASPSLRAEIEDAMKQDAAAGLPSSASPLSINTAGQAGSGTCKRRRWLRWCGVYGTATAIFAGMLLFAWAYHIYHVRSYAVCANSRRSTTSPGPLCDNYQPSRMVVTPPEQSKAATDNKLHYTVCQPVWVERYAPRIPPGVPRTPATTTDATGTELQRHLVNHELLNGPPIEYPDAVGQHLLKSRGITGASPYSARESSAKRDTGISPLSAEQYERIVENSFLSAEKAPLSTFSIDVDTAAYANMRRFINEGRLPPPDAVRIEEMVNYFSYDYPQPLDETPFTVNMETAQCPWRPEHRLLRIGLKGREIDRSELGPSNIVFLLDVSGSMNESNKLPLVKRAMRMLVEQLTEDDRVAIVTYASGTATPLPSARGNEQKRILETIDSLQAGGSTHGSAGIELAYQQAAEHFVPKGINRVILCTDGDLNVGITDDDALIKLIEQKAKSGVFLTVLGFGTGNLKDAKMEKLADHGNGLYAYIDSLREAHRVLIEQMTGNLATIAKDVKLQIEFNPAEVAAYRLIGYENRVLAARDFDDDRKDAGEIGAGHTVTALYELIPASVGYAGGSRGLKYQKVPERNLTDAARNGELLTLRLRYKEPDGEKSKLLERIAKASDKQFARASDDFRFAASVAAFGMVLRNSAYRGDATLPAVEEFAAGALGRDPNGHRAEFLDLVRRARGIKD